MLGRVNGMNNTNINEENPEETIFIFEAENGMILSQNVTTSDGTLVVKKNSVLNQQLITQIASLHILEISIFLFNDETPESSPDNESYYEKVRNSETFHRFQKSYISCVDSFKSNLNDIVTNNAPIDPKKLLHETIDLVSQYKNNLELFDMLHSMRHYDDLTYMHCINVALISSIIGKWLNYSQEDVNLLCLCGLLHDIGKLNIPDDILSKPGILTTNEYNIMKNHVNLGYNRLRDEHISQQIKAACLLHHEKCDGSGYPFHLKSKQIPDFTKIITIADIYDAMTANRVYRGAICPFTVIQIMEQDAYTKYDPRFIIPFLKNVVASYINTNVKLSDGRRGQVIMLNSNNLSKPVVQCNNLFIDLSKEKELSIAAMI